MLVPDLLHNATVNYPDHLCVAEGERRRTFRDVDERADRFCAALRAHGIQAGDRVALLALNELEYVEIVIGAMRADVILVPLNYRLAAAELSFMLGDCGAELLISGPEYEHHADSLAAKLNWRLSDDGPLSYNRVLSNATPVPRAHFVPADQPAQILYSSGTTGRPKGALLSAGALWARAQSVAMEAEIVPDDVFVQCLPMFHIAQHNALSFTLRGATIVLVRKFVPVEVIATLRRHAATQALLVPTMINMLTLDEAPAKLPNLRMIQYGASPISPDVLRRAIKVFDCGFFQHFGMTETSGVSILRPRDHDPVEHPERLASAGTDALNYMTRIVDENDNDVQPGEIGQIISRGPGVMLGYWNMQEATSAALVDGWMHTGDAGYRSDDGYLYVTDRIKDMVISGGENVYPREVEDVLYAHPRVLEAAVVGVPDSKWGERLHAVIVLRGGASRAGIEEELSELCRTRLAGYKCPRSFELVDELPRNATGKVLKRLLRADLAPA